MKGEGAEKDLSELAAGYCTCIDPYSDNYASVLQLGPRLIRVSKQSLLLGSGKFTALKYFIH